MSNHRRGEIDNIYRTDYLHSKAWYARRARWFREHATTGIPLECAACRTPGAPKEFELHHADYTGITLREGRWYGYEHHDDLLPLHPYCHELLHRLIDRDQVLSRHRTRSDATRIALDALHTALAHHGEAS